MMTQLNPTIPVETPLGHGMALFLDADDHSVFWGVAQQKTGEMWWWDNQYIRLETSISGKHVNLSPIVLPPDVEDKLAVHRERYNGKRG